MSLEGLNNSAVNDLLSNRDCFNFTKIDLRNASISVINSLIYDMFNVSNITHNPNSTPLYWVTSLCITLFGLITNSMLGVTVVKTPSLHTTTYILLMCLACSDCIILMTRIEVTAQNLLDYTAIEAGNTFSNCLSTLCFLLSTGFVILASEERYLAICHPLTHHRLKGTKRTAKVIAIVFLISAAGLGMYFPLLLSYSTAHLCIIWPVGDDFHVYPYQMLILNLPAWYALYNKVIHLSLGVIFLLVLASVSYMYAKILTTLAKRKRNTNLQLSAEFKKHIEQVSVMVIVNGGVYFLLTFIYVIYLILVSLPLGDMITFRYWQLAAFVSYGVNASINPLIYFMTNKRYRCAVKAVFGIAKNSQNTPFNSSNMPDANERRL